MDFMTIFIKNLKLLLLPNSNNDTCNMCNARKQTLYSLYSLSLSRHGSVTHKE